MSIDVDFIFSIPSKYSDAAAFAEHLATNFGFDLALNDDRSCWLGYHLGMSLAFSPEHKMDDDQRIPYSTHRSSIGLTGYASTGQLRHAMVPMVLNIAMAVCYFDNLSGYLIRDCGTVLAHFGWDETKAIFVDFRNDCGLIPLQIVGMYQAD